MRVCPRCQGRYDDESRFCPRDGAELPAPAADPRLGEVLLGQFELLEVCGRGAMGTVYRAWQSGMDREVAVKLLRTDYLKDPSVVKRFHREARSVARLHHPNVVTVFLVGETTDHTPFMVMEYVDGVPLSVGLALGEAMPAGRALRIARQIASALAEAHGSGIVHRDLKPANILLEQRRRAADVVKVVDFGIAKIIGGDGGGAPGESALTRTGTIFGTPHYLSPEQAQGTPVDGRADLYSLGVILFAMLTGRVPFEGSGMAVVVQHVNQAPPRPSTFAPGLPAPVEALVLALMEKDPNARPQSAEDVTDAIDALLVQLGEAAAPTGRAESTGLGVPARAASQPSVPVVPIATSARDAAPPALTIKATALASPAGKAPPAVTVKGAALMAPTPASAPAAVPAVTVKAQALPVPPELGAMPPGLGVMPADVTVPPPGQAQHRAPIQSRLSAETAYAMPDAAVIAGMPLHPHAPISRAANGSRALSAGLAVPASAMRPSSALAVPESIVSAPSAPTTLDGGSDVWRPPSPWRRVLVVFAVLVFLGGAAAAGVFVLRRPDDARAPLPPPPSPSAKPSPILGAPDGAVPVAGAERDGGFLGVGDGDAAPAASVSGDAGRPPGPPAGRVITLGEGGWAVRLLLPAKVIAGEDIEIAIEAWDPAGTPVGAGELRMVVEEPGGVERAIMLPGVVQAGRFEVRRRFASAGSYSLHIYPETGKSKPVVWFELHVEDPDASGVLTRPEPVRGKPARPATKPAKAKKDSGAAKGGDDGVDPYHLLEDLGGGGATSPKKDGAGDKPAKPTLDPSELKPKPKPEDDGAAGKGKNGAVEPAPKPKIDSPPPAPKNPGADVELE